MKHTRGFWTFATGLLLTVFLAIHYLLVDPTASMAATFASAEIFSGSRGLTMTTDQANETCMIAVYIAASKVAAKHASAPTESPDMIYMRCMMNAGVLI